jgi:sugar/nucleoside kinase (ribokinase family)
VVPRVAWYQNRIVATSPCPSGRLGVIGDLLTDVVVWLSGPPERGTDTAAKVSRARGGSAANVAAFAAPLVPTRFIGCVGEDAIGDALVAELVAAGVDVRVRRQGRTGTVVILVEPGGERTMFPDRGACADLVDVPEEWARDLDMLHVPAYCFARDPTATSTSGFMTTASQSGSRVSFDTSSVSVLRDYGTERYLALVAQVRPSIVFANSDEAALLGLRHQRPPGGGVFVVKDGIRPTAVINSSGDTTMVQVAPIVTAADSTGAGDAFAAGYLAAALCGAGPVEAVTLAHARARLVLRAPGAAQEA